MGNYSLIFIHGIIAILLVLMVGTACPADDTTSDTMSVTPVESSSSSGDTGGALSVSSFASTNSVGDSGSSSSLSAIETQASSPDTGSAGDTGVSSFPSPGEISTSPDTDTSGDTNGETQSGTGSDDSDGQKTTDLLTLSGGDLSSQNPGTQDDGDLIGDTGVSPSLSPGEVSSSPDSDISGDTNGETQSGTGSDDSDGQETTEPLTLSGGDLSSNPGTQDDGDLTGDESGTGESVGDEQDFLDLSDETEDEAQDDQEEVPLEETRPEGEDEEESGEPVPDVVGSSLNGTGTPSGDNLALLADTTMTGEIPEITGETVTDQLSSLCGEDSETEFWGDPVINFYDWNPTDPDYSPSGTNTNLAYSDDWGFGWVDWGNGGIADKDNENDYYQIGRENDGWFDPFWGDIFSLQSSISTSASYAIRVFATNILILGDNSNTVESLDENGAAISIESPTTPSTDQKVTIQDVVFKGTTGISGTIKDGMDGGVLTLTLRGSTFSNTEGKAIDIDANGADSTEDGVAGGKGGTISVTGTGTVIEGDVTLAASGGNGYSTETTVMPSNDGLAGTFGGDGGTIELEVQGIDGAAEIVATGGAGGAGASGGVGGGAGGSGGSGGIGGEITISVDGELTHEMTADVSGGNGGAGGDGGDDMLTGGEAGNGGTGGDGGPGGKIVLTAEGVSGTTALTADGGAGGIGGSGGVGGVGGKSGNGGSGGAGGPGGEIDLVIDDIAATVNATANGGIGGSGGMAGQRNTGSTTTAGTSGSGGKGGLGGTIIAISPTTVTSDGTFNGKATGGAGGTGGSGFDYLAAIGDGDPNDYWSWNREIWDPEKISPETIGNSGSGGSGGDGGWIQFVNEGNLDGSMTIDVSGGSGGGGGMFAATGTAGSGGAGGLGGLGQVWAKDLTESITITSNGGAGGTGGLGGAPSYLEWEGEYGWWLLDESHGGSDGGAGGTGGDAGVSNIILSGDMKADATLTSTGGNGGDGGETGNGGVGGAGGKGGSVLVFANDIGTIDTAKTSGLIEDTIDLTVDVSSGDGGTGGGGWYSHDKYGGDGGSSTPYPGGTRTTYSDIRMQFTGDVLSDARITAKAIGGDGGDAGKPGTYEAAKGADGGDGGHIYMWADNIAKDAEVTLDISGGAGGNGGTGGNGGNAPTETIYVSADTISGTVDATAAGGAVGGGGGSTAGTGGRVYVDGTITGGAVNIHGASTTTPPAVIPSPPIAPTAPTSFNSVERFSFIPPNPNLSPTERIAATILQLQDMGFIINPDDGLEVIVKDITYYIIPAIDPNNQDVWVIFDENGNLVGQLDALENLENVLDPETQAMVEELGNFVREIKTVDPAEVGARVEQTSRLVQEEKNRALEAAKVLDAPAAVTQFVEKAISSTSDRPVVAGWNCPAGYSPEQIEVQLKEDFMKNYLLVMEARYSQESHPDTLVNTDAGVGQQATWMVTSAKLMQDGQSAMEANYDTLKGHASKEANPWSFDEMVVYRDRDAAAVTVQSDSTTLARVTAPDLDVAAAGAEQLSLCQDVNLKATTILISSGIFTDDALKVAKAGYDASVSSFGLGEYVDARRRTI